MGVVEDSTAAREERRKKRLSCTSFLFGRIGRDSVSSRFVYEPGFQVVVWVRMCATKEDLTARHRYMVNERNEDKWKTREKKNN
jgi:hypothetical protein